MFNFPDAGVGVTPPMSVKANQDMLGAFFDSAKGLLRRNGEVPWRRSRVKGSKSRRRGT